MCMQAELESAQNALASSRAAAMGATAQLGAAQAELQTLKATIAGLE